MYTIGLHFADEGNAYLEEQDREEEFANIEEFVAHHIRTYREHRQRDVIRVDILG